MKKPRLDLRQPKVIFDCDLTPIRHLLSSLNKDAQGLSNPNSTGLAEPIFKACMDCGTKVMDKPKPLTVIIPCRNERKNIRACIESFHKFADEVLIADSLSTDDTVSIAKEYPKVRVVEREYNYSGDFKNWAIPQARNEWVLLLDADERVTPELESEIQQILTGEPEHDGYWIYRDNHFMGHRLYHGDAKTDKVIRLFKRDLSRYVGPSDHGEIEVKGGRVGVLKNNMLHYTVWDYDQYFRKFDRYTTLQAQQWAEQGKDSSYLRLMINPIWRFFREYIVHGGILDGKAGLQLSWLAAFYSFTKQARLWQINHGLEQGQVEPEEPESNASKIQSDQSQVASPSASKKAAA